MPRHRALHVVTLAAAIALLSACGGDDDRNSALGLSGREGERTEGVVVTIERSRFDPRELTVEAGAEITFRNLDAAAHTVTSAEGAPVPYDSGDLGEGEEHVVRYDEPGTHEYICEIHPTMRGTVVVE